MDIIKHKNIKEYYQDLALIELILQKDEAALEKLYFKYCHRLLCFISSHICSYDDSQDILQLTFMAALDGLDRFNGNSMFFTWLCGIARNKIRDYFRNNKRKNESLEELIEKGKWHRIINANVNSVDDILLNQELRDQVRTIIGMMPEHYQSLLVEKYLLNKSVKELAMARELSEKAVESLMTRARRYFKKLVEENQYISGGFTI